ncbi:hypothetical protein ACVBEH_21145, partial [Roseateles sp. GG27B]
YAHQRGGLRHISSRRGPSVGQENRDRAHTQAWPWLNIAELEFAVLGRTVFKKRIADQDQLQRELDAICVNRNRQAKPVQWQFNLTKARKKMAWVYPDLLPNEST